MRNYKPSGFISAMLHSDGVVKVERKTCILCGFPKPIKQFYKNPKNADGHSNECAECSLEISNKKYAKKKEEKEFYKQFSPI